MKSPKKVLKHIYLPILTATVVIIGLYTLAHYLLIIQYHLIEPKEILVDLFLPMGIAALFAYLFVRPKVSFLVVKDKTEDFLSLISVFAIGVPLIIMQLYINTENGKLTPLKSTTEITQHPRTKYYQIDNYYAFKKFSSFSVSRKSANRYGTEIWINVHFTCPMVDTTQYYGSMTDLNVWIGKTYGQRFPNHKWDMKEQPEKIQRFIDKSIKEFRGYNFHPQNYFKRLTNSEERDNFIEAIKRVPQGDEIIQHVTILEPEEGTYATRNGSKLAWLIGTFLGFQLLFFLLIYNRPIKTRLLSKYQKLDSSEKIKQSIGIIAYLVPAKGRFATSLLVDINLLVLLVMVASGTNLMEPSSIDLLHWGANFRPLVEQGEWWRLFTSIFVHAGLVHLVLNMFALVLIGIFLEEALSLPEYLILYLLTGVISSISSMFFHERTLSVGASGAIMGLYGIGLAMILLNNDLKKSRGILSIGLLVIIGPTLFMGLIAPVDNAAHLGGLISGFIIGLIYIPIKKYLLETS
ncbi:rhomboid family intramembrane serine protease [Prolixibacter denitrificans]|uniref:Rhomboid family intramembrane serine protease n=1 Tax=Prolixibacter denitrificans TaxID=1541063 RepID=A0A2P8C6Y4_9BACT|nr:rhomboid family intramembrane serine protease [Prolixibacter denitrificans]PSK80730.1 rhomboid protease GluP [Prolixibacter denitrificans]GET22471.1 rhomboid family intramembrane serine protease [Prolixibacter denitrificans]